jgi:transcriptional regulator
MYIPNTDRVTDLAKLHRFMRENSFATIISVVEGHLFATRVPLILDPARGPNGTLLGHVARANPQWRSFNGQNEVMAAFDRPHAYISPNWYVTTPAVPTWNYATVHAYGLPRIIEDAPRLGAIVDQLISTYEHDMPNPWPTPGQLPEDLKAKLLKAIVGFEIPIERIEGKFKFGHNRPVEDQISMIRHLEESSAAGDLALAAIMKHELAQAPDPGVGLRSDSRRT